MMSSMSKPASPSNQPAGKEVPPPKAAAEPKLRASDVNFFYGSFQALHGITLDMHAHRITAMIGPSGCGKSTFLRNLNRINETIRHARMEGKITLDSEDIAGIDITSLRRRVGMVFQRPN